jgi:site-specific recombinase XerD
MTTAQAVKTLSAVIRRKHLALNTEQIYCGWLKRYCNDLQTLPPHLPSELKLERFLTALAQNHVSASTQNQAFNAILFFYKEAMGVQLKNIQALRARRPSQLRRAPDREDTLLLIKTAQAGGDFATSLVVRLLYGCGLQREPV